MLEKQICMNFIHYRRPINILQSTIKLHQPFGNRHMPIDDAIPIVARKLLRA